VGEHANVKADIRGTRVLVRGRVEGSIVATQRIELAPGCDVTGSLSANQVVLIDGARFNGRIDMDQRTIAARLAQYKAQNAATA
jgi:cytoskeletal protein CcmA (bactofilin family)